MTKIQSLDDLKDWNENPREITNRAQAGLAISLEEFGDLSGIVFNATLGALVSGHQRVKTIREKWGAEARIKGDQILLPTGESVRIRVVNWDRVKHTAANIAANNPTIGGVFTAGLAGLVDELERDAPTLSTGLNIDRLKMEFEEFWNERKVEEDVPPPAPREPRTKPGDLYEFRGGGTASTTLWGLDKG